MNAVLPEAAEAIEGDGGVLERSSGDESRYYLVGDSEFRLGQTDLGQVLMFTDVTASERKRRELERHNDQLEGLAAAIRHELRNTLQIVRGRVDVAGDALDRGDVALARESFETATETADRMERIVEDLSALAQYGQTIGETERVDVERAVREARERASVEDLSVTVEDGGRLEAGPGRLQELLGDAFEFAEHNGASTVTVSMLDDGFVVTGDGEPPNGADPEQFFEYGGTVPHSETGTTLPNLRTLAHVHGWSTTVDTDYEDGVRIVVSGVQVDRAVAAAD